jgi:NAD(P)H-dependent flavin oxidoreductase YrpB (nitropropane dioxygenase family)
LVALTGEDDEAAIGMLRKTRVLTQKPFGINLILAHPYQDQLAISLREGVPIISLFWGDPAPLVEQIHAAGAVILFQAGSAEVARRAADCGVDVIVAQGMEAGGHVRGTVATLPLIPRVVDPVAVAPTPVVAAGGIADGRGLAAVLALGAAGAWIGTRFLASHEAVIHPRYREILLQAKETETFYTELFDVGWPKALHRPGSCVRP